MRLPGEFLLDQPNDMGADCGVALVRDYTGSWGLTNAFAAAATQVWLGRAGQEVVNPDRPALHDGAVCADAREDGHGAGARFRLKAEWVARCPPEEVVSKETVAAVVLAGTQLRFYSAGGLTERGKRNLNAP